MIVLLGAAALLILAGLTWLVFQRPFLVVLITVFVLAATPSLQVPKLDVGVAVPLALLSLAARFTGRWEFRSPRWAETSILVLVAMSFFAFLGNHVNGAAVKDFAEWSTMSLLIVPLTALRAGELITAGRTYAFGAGLGAAIGLGLRLGDPSGHELGRLTILGYTPDGLRNYIPGSNGQLGILRLTGPYLDPNIAALLMTFGLMLALALLRGVTRLALCAVLVAAIALTFSRAGLAAVVVAVLVLLVIGRFPRAPRLWLTGFAALGAVAVLAVPDVRIRLLNSFGSSDAGTQTRTAALEHFPSAMSGHWILGYGFGTPQLVNGAAAALNVATVPANAALLPTYRDGVVAGLLFVVILVIALVRATRLLRHGTLRGAALGAGAIGLVLVAFQLDIPIVTLLPAVAMFSILLAFLDCPLLLSVAEDRATELQTAAV